MQMCECFDDQSAGGVEEELGRRQEELAFMATHDTLTGLPNRTLIVDRLSRCWCARVAHQTPVAALFIDIDNFKSINETLSHGAGDELLRSVAERLDGVVRDTDALGRLGGDEFVVIAEELSTGEGPELIAERLLEALKEPFTLSGAQETHVTVTASIGIATARDHRPRSSCATRISRCTKPSGTARTCTSCSSPGCTTRCKAGWSSRWTSVMRSRATSSSCSISPRSTCAT